MEIKKHSLIGVAIILFFSCNKNNAITDNTEFPNKVGNHWHYKYTYGAPSPGSIDVDIIGQGTLPDGERSTIWVYRILSYTDTCYVVSNGNTVVFYNNPCLRCTPQMPSERMRYIFPLQTGNFWFNTAYYGDTTKVLLETTLSVPAGSFEHTFELNRIKGHSFNSWASNLIWFTPNIGFTKLDQEEFSLGPVLGNGVWELDSYTLN
jgi:hypothetical protein